MAGRHFAQPLTYQDRSFFGVLRILETSQGQRVLLHGTTVHGSEWVRGPHRGQAGVYYHEGTVLGRLAGSLPDGGRMAIVGLGTGALAQQLRAGQHLTYYEIDPLVLDVARERFGFLGRSRGQVELRVGDGRLALAEGIGREPPYDLILVDAFSSDAIPTHLLTREALRIYLDRLSPDGILAFHISNSFFDLEPVIAALAADAGLAGARVASEPDAADMAELAVAVWAVVLARDPLRVQAWAEGPGGRPLPVTGLRRAWTDDHVDLLSALRR
jgi:spermidine synthase